jgi:prepilin-type N-terminal cleavage/methylation domain-containing protein
MLQDINQQCGFTLIELVVATAIFGAVSLISVQMLWNTLSSRSKQYSIENSSSVMRPVLSTITQAIESATRINVSGSQIRIWGSPCRTIEWSGGMIKQSIVDTPLCDPPLDATTSITPGPPDFTVDIFDITQTSSPTIINIKVRVTYQDKLGSHVVDMTTSAVQRVNISI